MKPTRVLLLLLTCVFLVPAVSAFSDTISYEVDGVSSGTDANGGEWSGSSNILDKMYFNSIENFHTVRSLEHVPIAGMPTNMYIADGSVTTNFTLSSGAYTIGTGTLQIVNYPAVSNYKGIIFFFDSWDVGTVTGTGYFTLTTGKQVILGGPTKFGSPSTYPAAGRQGTGIITGNWYTDFYTPYKATVDVSDTDLTNNTYNVLEVNVSRDVDGESYPSTIVISDAFSPSHVYLSNYSISGSHSVNVWTYPTTINISFGYPVIYESYFYTLTGDNANLTIIGTPTPTPTPTSDLTVTVTATPTPRPAYCSYWTATPANTSIFRGQNVTYSLTETDPDNAFAKIEYYTILPNGAKVPDISYVKDNYGLFGFGVTWVKVDPVTNIASSSSEAAAKAHEMWFNVSGKNYVQIDISDDKSLLGAIGIHDWQIVCSFLVDVNVGGPTTIPLPDGPDGIPDSGDEPEIDPGPDGELGTPDDILPDEYYAQIGINVWEQDTKAVVYGTTICVYDYSTGEWTNKSNGAGGATTYFYVTPLRNIRVYVDKSPWVTFDQTFQVPNPPGTYGVYLKRPMTPTGTNTSYVVFAVKAAEKLFPLSGATIKISNATFNTTIVTNSAGGAQTELAEGETYNYVISRYGYLKVSNYFDVTVDDLYLTVTMNIDPENPPEYVQPTWTEIIIQTGATTAPAGTSGISPVGTGTEYRANNLEQGINIWYDRFAFLQELFFLVVVVGALGLMMKAIPGGRGGRRR